MGNTTVTAKDATGATKTFSGVTDAGNSSAVVTKHFLTNAIGTAMLAPGAATALPVSSDGSKATYATGALGITPAATPGDVIQVQGSATTTVRIKKLTFQGVASTAKQWPVTVRRAVAAHTDGTAVAPVITKFDTGDAAAAAVVTHLTANPAAKASNPADSVLFVRDVTFTAPASAAEPWVIDFCQRQDKALVLRGAADCLVVSLGGGALTAGEKFSYSVEWEEDAS